MVAMGMLMGPWEGRKAKTPCPPLSHPLLPQARRDRWLGNPLCLESSPGSHQAPPWQGGRLEQSPHRPTPSQGQATALPAAPAPGCQHGSPL